MFTRIHQTSASTIVRAFILLVMMAAISGCKQQAKIVYVDNSRLMSGAKSFAKVRDSLTAFDASWKKNAQGLKDSVDKHMQDLQQASGGKTAKEFEASKARFARRQEDLNKYIQASRAKAVELEQKLTGPALNELNATLQKFRERKGYGIILGTTAGGNILAGSKELDVTDEVLKEVGQ